MKKGSFSRIIKAKRSIIVATDTYNLKDLVGATIDVPGITGYKFGIEQSLGFDGLNHAILTVKHWIDVKNIEEWPGIIYDHQKAGNDIPQMGTKFAKALANLGVDAAILFPFAGPATQEIWTKACFDAGLQVLTGGVMTHEKFLVSEGGYIADEAVERIYALAAELGVRHFVVPGTKIHWVKRIRELLDKLLGSGNYVLYAPGFISQGGDITECGQAAGDEWHAIVGSAIYDKPTREEIHAAAVAVTRQIVM